MTRDDGDDVQRRVSCWITLLLLSGAPGLEGLIPSAEAQSPFKHDYFAGNHQLDSAVPNEHVDPLSGNLLVTATDLVLPGNAGLDLAVTRIYSSQILPDVVRGDTTTLEDDGWAGLGWRLHFGVHHTPGGPRRRHGAADLRR